MKINPLTDVALAATAATGAVKAADRGAHAAPAAKAPEASASVTMSAAARSLDSTSAGSGVDEAKVASIRAAIANGTFTVNAGNIADKMLSSAQEFLSRAKG